MTPDELHHLRTTSCLLSPRDRAVLLAQLDHHMRHRRGFAAAVSARVRFFATAVMLGEARTLNALADAYAPRSHLSDRSLDRVFEDADVSTAVTAQLVHLADVSDDFCRALHAAGYGDSLARWRARAPADLFG